MPTYSLAPAATGNAPFTSVDAFTMAIADRPDLLEAFTDDEFALLLRSIELVGQSQAFSRDGLRFALRLSDGLAERITLALETLGIVAEGEPAAAREVRIASHDLPAMLVAARFDRRARRI